MRTIAVISQKGGAGKTTLAIHLAAEAAKAGLSVLILDTDPQATASQWSEWRGEGVEPEVVDCASPPLLPRKIAQAAELGADLVVIDTPPHADAMARAACSLADLVLVPCRPQAFDLTAVATTADLIRAAGKPAFLVFMGGPQRAPLTYKEATELVQGDGKVAGMGLRVAPAMLTNRAIFHHSTASGKVAGEAEPNGKAAEEVADLWKWTGGQVGVSTRKRASKAKGKAA
ncbi:ParA family partition ATPase [Sphingomonas oryzagri]|uniref:ParA family partition ATPase n=1 Tax=Sphingomonas oryzagri TaxID=3042314 RepID=A0ABT6N7Q1_9SPHN|nr:ParA family partition ATPase [Sphingomonas oryzagri]MDH7641153.1 ParA family partition ATPase [Sphingomonas oryzagri]